MRLTKEFFLNCVIAQNQNSNVIIAIRVKKDLSKTEKLSHMKDEQHEQFNSTAVLPIKCLTRLMSLMFFIELYNK